jgi:hypothetical protein
MKIILIKSLIVAVFMLLPGLAVADDLEGRIESVDQVSQSLVVNGIIIYATSSTEYDDGLRSFNDLHLGQKVEIDFKKHDGVYYATEIELDD